MRAAFCLYGPPTDYIKGYQRIEEFQKKNSFIVCDFFIHTGWIQMTDIPESIEEFMEIMKYMYNPKMCEYQHDTDHIDYNTSKQIVKHGLLEWYSTYTNAPIYDIVILSTFDCKDLVDPNTDEIYDLCCIDPNRVYTSNLGEPVLFPFSKIDKINSDLYDHDSIYPLKYVDQQSKNREIRFSLCIPTMNRFDKFLDQYLYAYLDMKSSGIIDEIIVCDETGEDYRRILEKYNKGDPSGPIQLYKNETRLGVFKNKIRVASYAKDGNFIALIDSDNFVNRNYFEVAKNYILKKRISIHTPIVLAPIFCRPHYEFSYFNDFVIDRGTAGHYIEHIIFQVFMNTGNYVMTKPINSIKYIEEDIQKHHVYDVVHRHLITFQQIPEYCIHAVKDLEYLHVVHDDSYYQNNIKNEHTDVMDKIIADFRAFL